MALLLRSATNSQTLRTLFTHQTILRSFSTAPSHSNHHRRNNEYLTPNPFINSWDPPKDPKEAQAKLALVRREYFKKVREVRKECIHEVEMQRIEKKKQDEAKMEAQRIANEERRAAKAAAKKARAAERQLADEAFRKTLLKERTEKLEYWRKREELILKKKEEKKELLRRQSSIWIDEPDLEKNILSSVVDTIQL